MDKEDDENDNSGANINRLGSKDVSFPLEFLMA